MRRVASIPLMPSPLNTMSINTTFGRCSSASPIASSGVLTGGAMSTSSSSRPTTVARASVRSLWSSQINKETMRSVALTLPSGAAGCAGWYPLGGHR